MAFFFSLKLVTASVAFVSCCRQQLAKEDAVDLLDHIVCSEIDSKHATSRKIDRKGNKFALLIFLSFMSAARPSS